VSFQITKDNKRLSRPITIVKTPIMILISDSGVSPRSWRTSEETFDMVKVFEDLSLGYDYPRNKILQVFIN
jgi:hypothetical protein